MNPFLVGGIVAAIAWVLSRGQKQDVQPGTVSHPFDGRYRAPGGTSAPADSTGTGSGSGPGASPAYATQGGVGMSPNVFPFGPFQASQDGGGSVGSHTDAPAAGVPTGPVRLPVSRYMGGAGRGNDPIARKKGGCGGDCGGCKSSCALDCPASKSFSDGRSPLRVTGPGSVLGDVIADVTVPSFYDPASALNNYDAIVNSLLSAESNQVLGGSMTAADAFDFYSKELEKVNAAASYQLTNTLNPYQIGYQGNRTPRSVDLPINQAPGAINPLLTFTYQQQQTLNAIVKQINTTSHLFPQQQEYEYLRAAGISAGEAIYMAMNGSVNGMIPTPAPTQADIQIKRNRKFTGTNMSVGHSAVVRGNEFFNGGKLT